MKDNIKVYVEMNPAAESFRDALVISTTSKKVKVLIKDHLDQAFTEAAVKYPERKRAAAARENGVWDDPAVVALGALDIHPDADVKRITQEESEDVQTTGEGSRDTEDRGC